MDDSFFKSEVEPGRYVCLSPLTSGILDDLGVDGLGDDFGYFVYETEGTADVSQCVNVLAKCPSFEAASRLLQIYRGRAAKNQTSARFL